MQRKEENYIHFLIDAKAQAMKLVNKTSERF